MFEGMRCCISDTCDRRVDPDRDVNMVRDCMKIGERKERKG